jgi:2-polyprenyl-3-methyl-5-hydroxy-6-metoxy-1,4-benzoquinol methylase
MLTETQFAEGVAYAKKNFQNEDSHLILDKEFIKEKFDLTGMNVLDFGCGMGGMTLWYAKHWNCRVKGVDIDNHHIAIAKHVQQELNISNVSFEKRNIRNDPLPEKFDIVFINDVVEHIEIGVLQKLLASVRKSLTEGGKIFISYPPWRSPYASHLNHVIKIPWCQFLPKPILNKMIEEKNHTIVGEEESTIKDVYTNLNHLTNSKLQGILNATGLHTVFRKSHTILNRAALLKKYNINFFPFDFLVTKEFLLVEPDSR